jgi:hypothetical protein
MNESTKTYFHSSPSLSFPTNDRFLSRCGAVHQMALDMTQVVIFLPYY